MASGGTLSPIQSSLPLQMLVHYHWRFMVFYFFSSLAFLTFKSYRYYYPSRLLGWEMTPIFLYVIINTTRLLMISRGNKTNAVSSLVYSVIWGIPVITLYSYYIDLQTYILRVDIVINALALTLTCLEILLSSYSIYGIYISAGSY